MAKFFITNNQQYYKSLKEQIGNGNFQISFDYTKEGLYSIAVHKLGMQNQNAVQDGNDFCIATGTHIYKESLELLPLLADFNDDVAKVRKDTIGQYAVSIYKNGKLTIYGDACGCYDIYKYSNTNARMGGGQWIVSNSLYDIAKVIDHDNLSLNEFNVIERMANRYIPNAETFFEQIKYLRGDEYIHVDLLSSQCSINHIEVDFPIDEDSFDAVVEKAAKELKNNARIVAKVFGTPTICVTGGLDSRLVLASFLANGIKPKLLYGVGNNQITSPRKEDEICVDQLSKAFDLEVIKGDFSVSSPLDADWDNYIRDCGFTTAYMWGGQRNVTNSLLSGSDLLMFGWGGELYRNITGWTEQNANKATTLKELLSKWYIARAESAPLIREAIYDYDSRIEENMRKECKYLGLNPNEMSLDDVWRIEMNYRSSADTQIPSFIQLYKYSYLLLFESSVLRYRVKCREKDSVKFMLAVCSTLYPRIFSLPLFTHQQWKEVEISTMTLVPIKTKYAKWSDSFIAKVFRKIFPKEIRHFILRPFKRKLNNKQVQSKLAPNCVITSFDKLNYAQYNINMSDVRRSEDTIMWAILLRALKTLGY